jgi:hypothetical protein
MACFNVYLRFVAPGLVSDDPEEMKKMSWKDQIVNATHGPFTHVCMFYEISEAWYVVTISAETKYIVFKKVDHPPPSTNKKKHAYLKLKLLKQQMDVLFKRTKAVTNLNGRFSYCRMFTPRVLLPEKTDILTQDWFCSQLCAFLLQEAGVLHSLPIVINSSLLSVTELFLLVFHCSPNLEKSIKPEDHIPKSPNNVAPLCTGAIQAYMNLSLVKSIPRLNASNCNAIKYAWPVKD